MCYVRPHAGCGNSEPLCQGKIWNTCLLPELLRAQNSKGNRATLMPLHNPAELPGLPRAALEERSQRRTGGLCHDLLIDPNSSHFQPGLFVLTRIAGC